MTENKCCFHTIPLNEPQDKPTSKKYYHFRDVPEDLSDVVIYRCRLQDSRLKSNLGFLVLRQGVETIQGVLSTYKKISREDIQFVYRIHFESLIDVAGTLLPLAEDVASTTIKRRELHIMSLVVVSEPEDYIPFLIRDAVRPESEDTFGPCVKQDTRLDFRYFDLKTITNQAIFRVQAAIGMYFRQFFTEHDFVEIHTPKLIQGASAEGGSSVFSLQYFQTTACLAQSPQLHKQMAICADFERVFEVGPVFRAENSNTHRHLCEFTGLDVEMIIYENYNEVIDMADQFFIYLFEKLNEKYKEIIEVIHKQYPASPLKWLPKTPRITFTEAVELLNDAKLIEMPDDVNYFNLTTDLEKELGTIIREKFDTDYFIIYDYPKRQRPFYTMSNPVDEKITNSFDFFIRGEEVLSGAQRIHNKTQLVDNICKFGMSPDLFKDYLKAFTTGCSPHGGFGIGLERVTMLFLGLNNIRKVSLFPRDPKRISP